MRDLRGIQLKFAVTRVIGGVLLILLVLGLDACAVSSTLHRKLCPDAHRPGHRFARKDLLESKAPWKVVMTTPPSGGTNRIVWATVRSTGHKRIKGPTLDPPLKFQAHVRKGADRIVAYGPDSRVSQTAADAVRTLVDGSPTTASP